MTSLYKKIVLPVVLMITLILSIISVVSIYTIKMKIQPDIKYLTENSLNSKVREIDLWLNYNIESMQQLASSLKNTEFSDIRKTEIIEKLNEYKNNSQADYDSLGFITLNGEKFVTDGSHFNVQSREYYKKINESNLDTIVSKNIVSMSDGKNIVLIIASVYNENKEKIGYISAALTEDYIKDIVSRAGGNVDFNSYIINNDNEIVIGKPKEDENNIKLIKSDITSNSEWHLIMEIPTSFIDSKIIFTIMLILFCCTILLLVSAFAVNKYAKIISIPVTKLKNAMADVENGVFEHIIPDENISEFNSLGKSYNQMTDDIAKLMKEIRIQERLKNEADNKALFSQIKPHFLYNTLETIQAMAYDNDDEQVENAISNLATLFRIGLSDDRCIITLGEEVQHLKSYINIQVLRYGNMFDYKINCHNIDTNIPFMKFTLQPIVENAIYHGIKQMSSKGFISVDMKCIDGMIAIYVTNTCDSVNLERFNMVNLKLNNSFIPDNTDGYGLFNVNTRLKMNFGEKYGINLTHNKQCTEFTSVIKHPIIATDL
ncbi:sensor histidine kinase [Sedimentibacter sp. B4]|uniref:sensor histidine kinase n=1 Tax=Sedimentibacter sp. B4 TaxID=304766 RepID=UPI0002DAEF22|nr:sensor histidine kinase [Sedimentibacter sp. B4]